MNGNPKAQYFFWWIPRGGGLLLDLSENFRGYEVLILDFTA